MKINVCIGSSCHLKGARDVVQGLQELIKSYQLEDKVVLSGRFCMGNCQKGVSVEIDSQLFSMNKDNLEKIFNDEVLNKAR